MFPPPLFLYASVCHFGGNRFFFVFSSQWSNPIAITQPRRPFPLTNASPHYQKASRKCRQKTGGDDFQTRKEMAALVDGYWCLNCLLVVAPWKMTTREGEASMGTICALHDALWYNCQTEERRATTIGGRRRPTPEIGSWMICELYIWEWGQRIGWKVRCRIFWKWNHEWNKRQIRAINIFSS